MFYILLVCSIDKYEGVVYFFNVVVSEFLWKMVMFKLKKIIDVILCSWFFCVFYFLLVNILRVNGCKYFLVKVVLCLVV